MAYDANCGYNIAPARLFVMYVDDCVAFLLRATFSSRDMTWNSKKCRGSPVVDWSLTLRAVG